MKPMVLALEDQNVNVRLCYVSRHNNTKFLK